MSLASSVALAALVSAPVAAAGAPAFPGGPTPSARAPVAVAHHASLPRAYVVQRRFYDATDVNNDLLPSDRLTVVNTETGTIETTIPLPPSLNGQDQGIAVDSTRARVFVTNPDDDTLSIIDAVAAEMVATVPAGPTPTDVVVDPLRGRVYVANRDGVAVFNVDTGAPIRTVAVPEGIATALAVDSGSHLVYVGTSLAPKFLILDGATLEISGQVSSLDGILGAPSSVTVDPGHRVYVAFPGAATVAVVDLTATPPVELTRIAAGNQPNAVAADPATHTVYVTLPNEDRVRVYDSSGDLQATLQMRFPTQVAVNAPSGRAYLTGTWSDSLFVLNTGTRELIGRFALGTLEFGIAVAPQTGRLYAANFSADAVSVIDASGHEYLTNWLCGPAPWAVGIDESQGRLHTLNGDGTVTVLNGTDGSIRSVIEVGENLRSVWVSTNRHRVLVTSDVGLTVLDGTTDEILTNVVTGLKPAGLAVDEARGWIYVANQLSGTITVLDADSYQTLATWQPPRSNVWGLALDPAERRLYATIPPPVLGGFNGLEILDADTGAFLGELATGGTTVSDRMAGLVVVDTQRHLVYMTEPDNNQVYVVEGTNLVTTVTVGNAPHGIAVDEAAGLVYVANVLDGTVSVIDESDFAPLRITHIERADAQVVVTWRTQPGLQYQLQSQDKLPADSWVDVGLPVPATSYTTSSTNALGPSDSRFYRVKLIP